MRSVDNSRHLVLVALLGIGACGCGNSESGGAGEGTSGGTGGSAPSSGGGQLTGSGGAGPAETGGVPGSGGSGGSGGGSGTTTSGGSSTTTGGSTSGGGGSTATGGEGPGGAGAGTGGSAAGSAGAAGASSGGTTQTGDGCTIGAWPTADPTKAGPFTTVTENDVGPEAGAAEDDGTVPRFTLFRPEELGADGLCHPVITWGNGTGSTPNLYRNLLANLASHGFVVIGSNSTNVAQGDPRPMVVGVTWILEQNEDPSSELYHLLDPTNIGATGHSQGAVATSQAAGDSHITTNVPIEGAQIQRNLHGPAMLFCGGMDDIVGCDGAQSAFDSVTDLPAMYAEYLSVDHGSWLGRMGAPSVVEATVIAWMRVHLMGDDELRSWFYGPTCKLCTDDGWQIQQKNMDQ